MIGGMPSSYLKIRLKRASALTVRTQLNLTEIICILEIAKQPIKERHLILSNANITYRKNIIEIITNGENGYIYSKELNNLFEILQSISEIEFNKTSENAFQFAQKEYSIDSYIEREWADYLKVTNSN